MAAAAFMIAAALLGHARAGVVELNCSDNSTCIDNMAMEFMRSVRQQKTVRLFDVLTVEPLERTRQERSHEGVLSSFLQSHAFSFDWNDYTFKLWKAQDKNDALDLEVFESRTAKDISEEVPKKSKSKVEEESGEEDKKEKKVSRRHGIIRRRAKKKIVQAVIPLLFGMKSAGAVIFAMAVVTVLTMKAFVASKLALMVTAGMAVKKLYESYSLGAGLQNHPYLYSQYPIDFPSASSHAYSVSGVSPQFSPEMYNPTALATHSQLELLQHNDASAQQSQQAPTVQLLNSTRASERWDGKSKLQKLLEPIFDGIRSFVDPIANMFAIPATFRGLSSDVTTTKTDEVEDVKKPREILVAQPRFIAQRKMNYRKFFRPRPKKYTELKVDLDKLKKNKDLHDYIKTKKYKFNYLNTYYYPRVKYFVNPYTFVVKPKINRLVPYKKEVNSSASAPITIYYPSITPGKLDEWKPIIPVSNTTTSIMVNATKSPPKKILMKIEGKKRKRFKRSIDTFEGIEVNFKRNTNIHPYNYEQRTHNIQGTPRGSGFMYFIQTLADADPLSAIMKHASKYTKKVVKGSLKHPGPPKYYSFAYDMVMLTLDVIDGLVQVHEAIIDHLFGDNHHKSQYHSHHHAHKPHQAHKKKKKPQNQHQNQNHNQYDKDKNKNKKKKIQEVNKLPNNEKS